MSVTVVVPFRGDPDHLRRCVKSLLAQTHRDIQVLVIADGDPAHLRTRDSRVTAYRLPENRGVYYARAVALAATTTLWTAVVDADDWVEPEWLDTLLAAGQDVTLQGHMVNHWPDGTVTEKRARPGHPRPPLRHHVSHIGLYRTDRLRQVGGYHPGYRIGWDTLLVGLLRATGRVAVNTEPQYHRSRPDASLTLSPQTRIGSDTRNRVHITLRDLYARSYRRRHRPDSVRKLIADTVDPRLTDEIRHHADKIRPKVAA